MTHDAPGQSDPAGGGGTTRRRFIARASTAASVASVSIAVGSVMTHRLDRSAS